MAHVWFQRYEKDKTKAAQKITALDPDPGPDRTHGTLSEKKEHGVFFGGETLAGHIKTHMYVV